jgi:hypothetical protein
MDEVVHHGGHPGAFEVLAAVVDIERREEGITIAIVSGGQIGVDAATITEELAFELEFLDAAVRYAGDGFELGRVMEIADDEEGIVAADTVVDYVLA